MLSIFEVITPDGRIMSFPLTDSSNGYIVKEIEGLDPPKATLVDSTFAQLPGAIFQSSKREKRNIIPKFGFLPNQAGQTVESLRQKLYQYFMIESQVTLRFINTSGLTVVINGVVESFEAPLFSKDPSANISIVCHNPDFTENEETMIAGATTSSNAELLIPYEGTVSTGYRLVLNVNRSISNFTVHHRDPSNVTQSLYLQRSLVSGNIVTINTNIGSKAARLLAGTVESSLVGSISPQSQWSQLKYGENAFRVVVSGPEIPYEVYYTNKYGGL